MAKVTPREGEDLGSLIKRFNKKVMNEGILNELRQREYYLKPSDIRKEQARKRKKLEAIERRKHLKNY